MEKNTRFGICLNEKKNKIKSCLSEDIKRKDNKKFTGKDLHDFEKIYRRRIVHKHAKNG